MVNNACVKRYVNVFCGRHRTIRTETWQITLLNEEAKDKLVLTGLIVNNVQLEVMPLQDPQAFVSVKMPLQGIRIPLHDMWKRE